MPTILQEWNSSGTNETANFVAPFGTPTILLGVDWTASGANPVQCFTALQLAPPGGNFYWDSQSTGEGNGVRWSWRGALLIPHGKTLSCVTIAVATINFGGIMWGVFGDWPFSVQG
jgi:hypothetical protein